MGTLPSVFMACQSQPVDTAALSASGDQDGEKAYPTPGLAWSCPAQEDMLLRLRFSLRKPPIACPSWVVQSLF